MTNSVNSPSPSAPIHLSQSVALVLAQQFTADQLRHLAANMEANSPGMRARHSLDQASVRALAEMLVEGRKPTIGWWRRHAASFAIWDHVGAVS